jgi:hypothetical protein
MCLLENPSDFAGRHIGPGPSPLAVATVPVNLLKGNRMSKTRMSKTIAVFGVGPGMGRSIARRFGQEGFQVAPVARNQTRLDDYTLELAADGIEAAGFVGDLADREYPPGTCAKPHARRVQRRSATRGRPAGQCLPARLTVGLSVLGLAHREIRLIESS